MREYEPCHTSYQKCEEFFVRIFDIAEILMKLGHIVVTTAVETRIAINTFS